MTLAKQITTEHLIYMASLVFQASWVNKIPLREDIIIIIIIIITSDVLEHKWRASLKLHYCYMIDFNF